MLQYDEHRAIFEDMDAHLWAPNSGRMLWMTQPAWPSNMWQIISSDYDTQASFYGVKKACRTFTRATRLVGLQRRRGEYDDDGAAGMTVTATVYSLENRQLLQHGEKKDVAANDVTAGFKLDLGPVMGTNVVLVKLELKCRGECGLRQFVLAGGSGTDLSATKSSAGGASVHFGDIDKKRRYRPHPRPTAEQGSRGCAGEQAHAGDCVRWKSDSASVLQR